MPAKLSLSLLLLNILAGFHSIMLDAPVMTFAKHWAKAQGGMGEVDSRIPPQQDAKAMRDAPK